MRIASPPLLALLSLAVAVGCTPENEVKGDGSGDGGTTGSTGTTGDDPGPDYEEGCILVDGEGGYAWINDAIDAADDGSVIELCATVTDAGHEEAVVVDKRVTIVGPGSADFLLVPPTNENGVVITASGASVSGMTISTTRSGVVVGGVAGTEVTGVGVGDIKVYDAPNWAISVEGASDVTISNAELMANVYGGIGIDEATVRIEDSVIQNNFAYGVRVSNGSEVTLAATEVIGTQLSIPDDFSDGHGVYATEGSLIATEGSAFYGNAFVNVFADGADLALDGDEVTGALYGVVALQGDASLTDVTIVDGAYHGAFLISNGTVDVSGAAISGDPSVTVQMDEDEWNVPDDDGNSTQAGAGMLIQAPTVTVSDSTFVGYNHAGLVLFAGEAGTAALARLTFQDNGQHGIYSSGVQVTMEDVDITGLFELSEQSADDACTIVDRYGAAVFVEGTAIWSGGSVTDNLGYGASGIRAAMNIAGVEFSNNSCASVMNFGGDLTATGNSFAQPIPRNITNSLLASNIVDYQGGGSTITGNTFSDGQRVSDRESSVYDAGTYTYYYVYHDHTGADMFIYESGPTEVSQNTFADGVLGMQAYNTELVVSNNTWTNYFGQAVYVSGDVDVEVSDNEFTDVGGTAVSCSSGRVAMEDNVIDGGGLYTYTYDYYVDETLTSENTSNSLSQAINISTCSLSMDGDEISNRQSAALYSYNGSSTDTMTIEMIDVSIDTINDNELGYAFYGAVFAYAFYGTTDFYLEGVEISNVVQEHGIEIYNANLDGVGALTMVDSVIDTVYADGIYLYGSGVIADIQGSNIENAGGAGIYANSSAAVSMSDTYLAGSVGNGIELESSATLTLSDTAPSVSTLATGFGMSCGSGVTVDTCSAIDLTGNTAGEHYGCETFCDAD